MKSDTEKVKRYGSRAEVWHGTARMTKGRLTKEDFVKNKHGRIVSRVKSLKHSKNSDKNPLKKQGYQQKKGSKTFGPIFKEDSKKNNSGKSKSKKNNSSKSNNNNSSKSKKNNRTYLKKMGDALFKMF